MKKKAKAKIHWIPFSEGGRKQPPTNPIYSTVIHFENDNTDWRKEAWSIVVDLGADNVQSKERIVTIWFLAYDNPNAPVHFFKPGNRFELLEGAKVVARGEILDLIAE